MLALFNGHCIEQSFFATTIKSHVAKIVIMWSISLDENNNIGQVYIIKDSDMAHHLRKMCIVLTCIMHYSNSSELQMAINNRSVQTASKTITKINDSDSIWYYSI